jgi:hypothetical protein
VIVVYQTIQGQLTISSLNLVNVSNSYSFTTALTANQTASLSYFNSLVTALTTQLSTVLTPGTVIDAVYKSFPYFQLIFHNNAYQTITVVVLYDVLKNNATIITQKAVPVPAQPTPTPTQPAQPAQPVQPPISGGYSIIPNPLSDQSVSTIINYLITNLGTIIKSANLISV